MFVILKVDFGPMKLHEDNAAKGDLYTTPDRPYANANPDVIKGNGKVIDLVFPIVSLIICCVIGMIYTGGFFSGTPLSVPPFLVSVEDTTGKVSCFHQTETKDHRVCHHAEQCRMYVI